MLLAFVGSVAISAIEVIDNPTLEQFGNSSSDVGMGAIGVYGGLPGLFYSGFYFGDKFLGDAWPTYGKFRNEQKQTSILFHKYQIESMKSQGIYWR